MNAHSSMQFFLGRGVRFEVEGDALRVGAPPDHPLTDEDRAEIRNHKQAFCMLVKVVAITASGTTT